MLVQTVLGPLQIASLGSPEADRLWAEAVALSAHDMTSAIGKLPDPLRPAGRVFARASVGDLPNRDAIRAVETGDLVSLAHWQATLPDVREMNAGLLAEVHAASGDEMRGSVGRMLKIAQLLRQGNFAEAADRLARARSGRGIDPHGAPLASLGAWRAHTGMDMSIDWDDGAGTVEVP